MQKLGLAPALRSRKLSFDIRNWLKNVFKTLAAGACERN